MLGEFPFQATTGLDKKPSDRSSHSSPESPRCQGTFAVTTPRSAKATSEPPACPPPSARNAKLVASLHTWGRRACCHAARSARCARYRSRPSLRATSRLIVHTARHSRPAMTRSDSPPATPRKISSRSCSDRCRTDRFQGAGRTPPASSNNRRIDDPFLPSRRAIDRVGSPACRRSHNSAISAAGYALPASAV
jgi:hypothetical protein